MGKLVFDAPGEHYYETGVDQGVLYPYNETTSKYAPGVAWNGLTAVNESPDGAEPNDIYADNIKYLSILSAENYGLTIEALQSPEEFDECDGSKAIAPGVHVRGQSRKMFGFCWRTKIGNDVTDDLAFKYHLAWGLKASPSEQNHETVNDSPEAATLSWECKATPIQVEGFKPIAKLEIDSRDVDSTKLKEFLTTIYGQDADSTANPPVEAKDPELPSPDYVIDFFKISG